VIDLSDLTIGGARDLLDAGSLSSQELVEATLARIEETEPHVHAYVTVMADSARAEARRADEERANGVRRSPLQGIPVAVKGEADGPYRVGSMDLWVPVGSESLARSILEAARSGALTLDDGSGEIF